MQGRRRDLLRAAAAGLVVLVLTSAGCSVRPRRTLDASSVAGQIRAEVVRQYQLPAADVTVTCPDGIPEVAGRSFKCQATVAGQTLPIDGTVTNSAGRYRTRPGAAVIVLSSVAAELQSRVAAQERAPARVFCGDQAILVVPAGGSFSCTSMVAGHNRQLTVTVDDLEGHVHFSVAGGPAAQPQSS